MMKYYVENMKGICGKGEAICGKYERICKKYEEICEKYEEIRGKYKGKIAPYINALRLGKIPSFTPM